MNKDHFLTQLKIYLNVLPEEQSSLILKDYLAKFDKGESLGKTEEEIARKLGNPRNIAEDILNQLGYTLERRETPAGDWVEFTTSEEEVTKQEGACQSVPLQKSDIRPSLATRICQCIGIITLNGLFMFWVIFTLLIFYFSAWFTALVFIISPLLSLVSFFLPYHTSNLSNLSNFTLSIVLCGVGLLMVVVLKPLVKIIWNLLSTYTKWSWRMFTGKVNF